MTSPASPYHAPRSQTVQRLAEAQRFSLLGIAPARPSDHGDFFRQWLAQGKHGEMEYLQQHIEQRLDPARIVPGAKALICVADHYAPPPPETPEAPEAPEVFHEDESAPGSPNPFPPASSISTSADSPDPPASPASPGPVGRIARYAWRKDYHRDMKKRLHNLADELRAIWPEHTFRTTVDTAPVMEREHAQRAGLGWTGKHTLLIHPRHGSWFLLGEIITTLPLQTAEDVGQVVTNHCGSCSRCIDACPTQCITPYSIDAKHCISYLTIEHRGPIDPALHASIGQWIAGCDVCQEVCPFNRSVQLPAYAQDAATLGRTALPLLEILNWTPQARQAALQGSALKRIKLHQFKRNALIATANHLRDHPDSPYAATLRQRIIELANDPDEDPLVRLTASQLDIGQSGHDDLPSSPPGMAGNDGDVEC